MAKKFIGRFMYLKVIAAMYIVTALLLFLLALIVSRIPQEEQVLSIGVLFVYLLPTLISGYIIGKMKQSKKFIWGFCMGIAYYAILLAISILYVRGQNMDVIHFVTSFCICVAGGTIGGMVS